MRLKKTPFALAVVALCGAGAVPLAAQTSSATIEAEKMALSGYVIESGNRIRLTSNTGSATTSVGAAGTYDIQVFVLPETDGRPTLAVYKGTSTTPLQTYTYPLTSTPTSFTVKGVTLNAGGTIKLVGTWNGGAPARVDKIVLTRIGTSTPPPPTTPPPSTPPSYSGTPYSGTPVVLPKAFEASKFDKGGQGVAYKDLTQGNGGGQFRPTEDVDIVASTDAPGGGYAVNSFQTGEWLAYTVNVPANGKYDLAVRAANNQSTPAAFHIEVNGVNVTGSVAVPRTGSWNTFQWVGKPGVQLNAGKRIVKVVSDQQHFNLSAVSVLASGTTVPPVTGAPTVSLTAPTSGQTVSGQVPYAATVSQAVTKVDFTVSSANPVSLGTRTAPPYSGTLDTTKLENGDHTLTAVASDAQGKTTTAQVAFKVQNGTPPTGGGGTGTKPANMLFWSGFESGVSVGAPYGCYEKGCYQDLLGTDSASGFSWPPRIQAGKASFQVRSGTVSTTSTISNYIVNSVQTVTGRTGASTRVHSALMKQTGCTGTASQGSSNCSAQDPYLVRPGSEPGDLYISYWRKLDPTLVQKLVNSWHVVFEWKTAGDYRVIAQIVNYGGVTPYWQITGDNDANGGIAKEEFWRVTNRAARVPIGEWFKFEVFWHRSKGSDGRVWMAVNGQKLVEQYGPNIGINNAPIDRIMFMQLYSGASYPLEQWTDDVQIWSGFPTAKPGDPWYDGVYAPH